MLTQYQLKNKMKVLLMESHKAPVVAVQIWVKTGSADEKKGEEGISHFIEHLVFKGTRKFAVGEVAKTVESSGGEINAYTTFDYTVFHVTLSSEDLDVALECISEMMGFPRFDPAEIDREREVVIEEIKRSFDNSHQVASQKLFSKAFKTHPYRVPIIGFERNIRKVSVKKLLEYYHRRYVPSNMTLVVAGDYDKSKIKKRVENFYGIFEPRRLAGVKRASEPKRGVPVFDYTATNFQETSLNMAFRIPQADHPDTPALDLLSFILGQGDSSRLVRKLRLEKSLVHGVHAGAFNPKDPGLFLVGASFKAGQSEDVIKAIEEELINVVTELPSLEEVGRACLNIEAEEIFSLETVDGLARKVGTFQTLLNDPQFIQKYLKKLRRLSASDVLQVARKYLRPDTLTMSLMLHAEDISYIPKKKFLSLAQQFSRNLSKALKGKGPRKSPQTARMAPLNVSMNISPIKHPISKTKLSTGALVILKKNPEVPVLHMKAGFLGGLRLEGDSDNGVTLLLSNVWTSGSEKFNEAEIAAQVEGRGGTMSAFGGRNSIGMSLETLTGYEDNAFRVWTDVLSRPTFPQEAVTREAAIQIENLRTRGDHPSSVAVQLFMENIFSNHPYSRDLLGAIDPLKTMKSQNVKDHWRRMATSENAVFVAVGDFDHDKQLRYFENLSQQLAKGTPQRKTFQLAPLSEDKRIFSRTQKEQTHIILGFRGLSFTDADRYALQVLQAILAGQGGRLFLELRDKASLAYSVAPIHLEGIETGYFGAYIGCSPEKGSKAIEMLHQEFAKIISTAPSEEEVQRAKRYLIGQNHIGLQRNSAQCSSILFDELYGIDCEETFRFADKIKDLGAREIHQIAVKILTQPSVTVAVGPVQPW